MFKGGLSTLSVSAESVLPSTLARVIPGGIDATTLGRAGAVDVFVTVPEDIAGMNSAQIAQRLTIPQSSTGYQIIQFPTPTQGLASPVFRTDPGFVGGGYTAGGAREFVIPNGPIPSGGNNHGGAMMSIQPAETILTGRVILQGGSPVADEVSKRIFALTKSHLVKLGSDASGWDVLYRDPNDGRYWELIYPQSELQGGGPPQLRCLTADEAKQKYGVQVKS